MASLVRLVPVLLLMNSVRGQGFFDMFGLGGGMAMGGGFGGPTTGFAPATAPPIDHAAVRDARFTLAEEQMAEVMGESAANSPERQRIDRLIKSTGGKFTGDAEPLNYLVNEYMATSPPPQPPPENGAANGGNGAAAAGGQRRGKGRRRNRQRANMAGAVGRTPSGASIPAGQAPGVQPFGSNNQFAPPPAGAGNQFGPAVPAVNKFAPNLNKPNQFAPAGPAANQFVPNTNANQFNNAPVAGQVPYTPPQMNSQFGLGNSIIEKSNNGWQMKNPGQSVPTVYTPQPPVAPQPQFVPTNGQNTGNNNRGPQPQFQQGGQQNKFNNAQNGPQRRGQQGSGNAPQWNQQPNNGNNFPQQSQQTNGNNGNFQQGRPQNNNNNAQQRRPQSNNGNFQQGRPQQNNGNMNQGRPGQNNNNNFQQGPPQGNSNKMQQVPQNNNNGNFQQGGNMPRQGQQNNFNNPTSVNGPTNFQNNNNKPFQPSTSGNSQTGGNAGGGETIAVNRLKRVQGQMLYLNEQLKLAKKFKDVARVTELQAKLDGLNNVRTILSGGSNGKSQMLTVQGAKGPAQQTGGSPTFKRNSQNNNNNNMGSGPQSNNRQPQPGQWRPSPQAVGNQAQVSPQTPRVSKQAPPQTIPFTNQQQNIQQQQPQNINTNGAMRAAQPVQPTPSTGPVYQPAPGPSVGPAAGGPPRGKGGRGRRPGGRRPGNGMGGGGRRRGPNLGAAAVLTRAPTTTTPPGPTGPPPQLGDIRWQGNIKYVFADADGFDTFQWVKASSIPKDQLQQYVAERQAAQKQQQAQAATTAPSGVTAPSAPPTPPTAPTAPTAPSVPPTPPTAGPPV